MTQFLFSRDLAEAHRLRKVAMEKIPTLQANGGQLYDFHRIPPDKRESLLETERREFLSPEYLIEIAVCADWIALQPLSKTINKSVTSYGYKHEVERWFELTFEVHQFISNGSFIAAAVGMGLKGKPSQFERIDINWFFQLKKRKSPPPLTSGIWR